MRKKMLKRFWKRITAVVLSLILVVGVIWGISPLKVHAAYTCTAKLSLTLVGYEGEGTPEFGEVFLRLYDDRNDKTSYVDIELDKLNVSGSGTSLEYSCEFEGGKYYSMVWYCRCAGGRMEMYLTNRTIPDSNPDNFGQTGDLVANLKKTLYRVSFMDGDALYYEQYVSHGNYFYIKNRDPIKAQHTFQGWAEEKDSNIVVDYNNLFSSRIVGKPTTYYAVWDHPTEDAWEWKNDADSHWKACSCGELRNAAETHQWNEGIITKNPTDTAGEKTYTCTVCGRTRTEEIPPSGKPAVSGNDISVSGNDPSGPGDVDTPGAGDDSGNHGGDNSQNTGIQSSQNIGAVNAAPSSRTSAAANAGGKRNEPRTGDYGHVEIYATAAMIAGMTYLLLYFYDEERGMTEEEKKELVSRLIVWAKKGSRFRRILVLAAVFFLLCYYHSIGKRICIQKSQAF